MSNTNIVREYNISRERVKPVSWQLLFEFDNIIAERSEVHIWQQGMVNHCVQRWKIHK